MCLCVARACRHHLSSVHPYRVGVQSEPGCSSPSCIHTCTVVRFPLGPCLCVKVPHDQEHATTSSRLRDGRGKGRSPGSLSPMTPKQDFSTQVPFSQHAVHSLSRNPLWRFCAGWLSVYGTIPYLCGNPKQRKARATTRRQKRDTPSHLTVLTVSSSRSRTTKAQSARRDNKYKSAVSARELAAEP